MFLVISSTSSVKVMLTDDQLAKQARSSQLEQGQKYIPGSTGGIGDGEPPNSIVNERYVHEDKHSKFWSEPYANVDGVAGTTNPVDRQDSIIADPSLELAMRLASIRTVGTLDKHFKDHQYTVDLDGLMRDKANMVCGQQASDYTADDTASNDERQMATGSPNTKCMCGAQCVCGSGCSQQLDRAKAKAMVGADRTHAYATLCVQCEAGQLRSAGKLNPHEIDLKRFGAAVGYTGVGVSGKTGIVKFWWRGEQTLHYTDKATDVERIGGTHDLPQSSPFLRYSGIDQSEGYVSGPVDVEQKKLNMLGVNALAVVATPALATKQSNGAKPSAARYKRGGGKDDDSQGGFFFTDGRLGDNHTYVYHKTVPAGRPPYATVSKPANGEYVMHSGIEISTANFHAGPGGGRMVLTLDEKYYTYLLSENATVTLQGLEVGEHNITVQLFDLPTSKQASFISDYIHFVYTGGAGALPLRAQDLLGGEGGKTPVLEIISPKSRTERDGYNCIECSVDFLFDFACVGVEDEGCGEMWQSQQTFTADVYLNDVFQASETVYPGGYSSIQIGGTKKIVTGFHHVSVLITQRTARIKGKGEFTMVIAGSSSLFYYFNTARDIAVAESLNSENSAKSKGAWERLDGIQRSLNENTKHNFVKKGMNIISPESGSSMEERFTIGGGSLYVFYDIPWLNMIDNYSGETPSYWVEQGRHLQVPVDVTVEMIVTVPENATCAERGGKKGRAVKKTKGSVKGIGVDKCGGMYGEVSIPLNSVRGRVRLRNVGSGVYSVRFRLIDKTGAALWFKSNGKATTKQQKDLNGGKGGVETIASTSFTFVNYTMQDVREDMPWENTELTTQLWNIVQTGSVEDLEMLQAGNANAIHSRSKDGRGILWWAYEYGREDLINYCIEEGIDEAAKDKEGFAASQLKELYSGA